MRTANNVGGFKEQFRNKWSTLYSKNILDLPKLIN